MTGCVEDIRRALVLGLGTAIEQDSSVCPLFDKVYHGILLHKLQALGITRKYLHLVVPLPK